MNNTTQPIPNDLAVEKGVLGAFLVYEDALLNYGSRINADLFFDPRNKQIVNTMLTLMAKGQSIDVLSLTTEMRATQALSRETEKYIYSLMDNIFFVSSLETNLIILQELAIRRNCIADCNKLLAQCYDQSNDVFDLVSTLSSNIETRLDQFCKKEEISADTLFMDTLSNISSELQEIRNFRNGTTEKSIFVSSGFDDLDNLIGLFGKSRLYIVGARPGMGKSAFVVSMAVNASKRGKSGLIFSLEMSNREIMTRIISQDTNIPGNLINSLRIEDQELRKIIDSGDRISKLPIAFDDSSSITLSHFRARCKKLKKKGKLDYVILDYLQLMQSPANKNASTNDRIGELSKGLKSIAKDLEVPIIALSQLNRGVEGRIDKKPALSDLRDSGAVEQDADVVMLLWRPDYYGDEKTVRTIRGEVSPRGMAFIDIAKQRDGQTGVVPLRFRGEITKFESYSEPTNWEYPHPDTNIEPNRTFDQQLDQLTF